MPKEIYSKTTTSKVKVLEARVRKLKTQLEELEQKIEETKCIDSPLKPGSLIEWDTSYNQGVTKLRRGRVITIATDYYRGYEYRVQILSKKGTVLGVARVSTTQCPTLVE